jgi:hypothetical protein
LGKTCASSPAPVLLEQRNPRGATCSRVALSVSRGASVFRSATTAPPIALAVLKEDLAMKNRLLAPSLVLGIIVTLAGLHQADASQVSAGSIELSPKVSFTHSNLKREGYGNVDRFTEFDLTPSVGFCLTDHYEITSGVLLRHNSSNGEGTTALGVSTGLLYNFSPQGNLIPFAGIGFGVLFYDGFTFNNTAVLAPDLTGGARVLVGNTGSVNLSLSYQHESDGHVSTNRLVGGVGVSLFPWRAR